MKAIVVFIAIGFVTGRVAADSVIGWVDIEKNEKPKHTVGYIHSSGWEAWSFNEPVFPIREVGWLGPVAKQHDGLTLGGVYLSDWAKTDQQYLLPFGIQIGWKGDWSWKVKYGVYLPLNGGSHSHFSDEARIVKTVDKKHNLQLGAAVKFYDESGNQGYIMAGPIVRLQGKETSVSLRYLPIGNGPDQARLEISHTF